MEWFNKLLPIGTLVFGWFLNEYGKYLVGRKEDKRKLKRLLFNLLELRHILKQIAEIEISFDSTFAKAKEMSLYEIDSQDDTYNEAKKKLIKAFQDVFLNSERIDYVGSHIEKVVNELSEIDPVFAFELKDKYNVKAKLQRMNTFIKDIEAAFGSEHFKFDYIQWFMPKVTAKLLADLDGHIKHISNRISWLTWRSVAQQLKEDPSKENQKVEEFLSAFFKDIDNPAYKR